MRSRVHGCIVGEGFGRPLVAGQEVDFNEQLGGKPLSDYVRAEWFEPVEESE